MALRSLWPSIGLLVGLIPSVVYFFSYPEVDPDLWGHLFFGREISAGGRLPLSNVYSYTAPDYRWINHEWLSEIFLYAIFRFFGSPGLIGLKIAIGAAIVWMLNLLIRARFSSRLVRLLSLIWVMAILSPGFNLRPQIFSYFFFTFSIFLLYRYEKKKRKTLYGFPVLMVFWVNLHGGFVAGLGALALFALWAVASGLRAGERVERVVVAVCVPFVLSMVALLWNPYGVGLVQFVASDLLLSRPISEWGPVPLTNLSFLEFKLALLFVILLGLWRGDGRRWDFWLIVLAAVFALRHQRHIPLFAVAAACSIGGGVAEVLQLGRGRWVKRAALAVVSLLAVYQIYSAGETHLRHGFQLVMSPREYPTQAAAFLIRNGVQGNLAVPFNWGEYLIWKLYPQARVSIDGRYTTAYPMGVIEDNFEWMRGGSGWRRLLDAYPTEVAVTSRIHPVTVLMREDPEWVYVYSDPVAFIFVRKTPAQETVLKKLEQKKLLPPHPPNIYFPG